MLCTATMQARYQFPFKALIGNPNCWPEGSILLVSIICCCLLSLILLLIWFMLNRCRRQQTVASITSSIELTVTSTQRANTPFYLSTLRPSKLYLTETILVAIAVVCALSSACQNDYMRHSIELTCSQRGVCRYEFRHALLFNHIQTYLCMQLRYENVNIDQVKVKHISENLVCKKVSLFWIRDTHQRLDHVTRRGMPR